jgi:hypothetical protein
MPGFGFAFDIVNEWNPAVRWMTFDTTEDHKHTYKDITKQFYVKDYQHGNNADLQSCLIMACNKIYSEETQTTKPNT